MGQKRIAISGTRDAGMQNEDIQCGLRENREQEKGKSDIGVTIDTGLAGKPFSQSHASAFASSSEKEWSRRKLVKGRRATSGPIGTENSGRSSKVYIYSDCFHHVRPMIPSSFDFHIPGEPRASLDVNFLETVSYSLDENA